MIEFSFTQRSDSPSFMYAMESWLDAIYTHNSTLAILMDEQHICRYLSPNFERVTGKNRESIIGHHADACIHSEDLSFLLSEEATSPEGIVKAQDNLEFRIQHENGSWHWYKAEAAPANGLALNGCRLLLCHDVTRAKLLEHRLEQSKLSADLARRSRTQFLSHIHHELRTPLNAIIGFAEMMRAEMFGPIGNARYHQYVEHIRESSDELLSIVNNMLELTSLTSGETELKTQALDARMIIKQAISHCQDYATLHHVTVQQCLPTAPIRVTADPDKLRQCICHVLHNAIKFSAPYSRVTLGAEYNAGQSCQIVIIDSGEGMSERKIRAVMKPFNIDEVNVGSRVRGAGLGLTLAKEFISLHEGSLAIKSARGEGTTVTLMLPLEPAANDDDADEYSQEKCLV